ncbi:uncharacterized protein OCT59_028540 [Rhizophagus irregularis]|uniref:uncharacterized protein n=1 Tax=Rhizophagus irregularis TaxID=588596 RepID=UPI001A0036A6|nr:hypothetical protein OCT59_028540 [Rhizophagus irregularis]GET50957.1 hypothetical protein GLOIN_2v1844572 [Rhizophagus irregularis DAOM 181602=DAOM 197198]
MLQIHLYFTIIKDGQIKKLCYLKNVFFHISTATEIDCHYDNNELNFMNEQNILSNSFCPQQVNVPAAVSFSEHSEILSSPQNFEFYDNNYNVHEI